MRNTIYVVEFEGNKFLNGEFDFRDEAIAWAEDHISEKPIVTALDVEVDEDTYMNKVLDREEIFHYPVEEEVPEEVNDDQLEQRLADLENELSVDPFGADEFDGHENLEEEVVDDKNAHIVDYAEYKHSYAHALEPKLRKINYLINVQGKPLPYIKAVVKNILMEPEVRWTDKEQTFLDNVRQHVDVHQLYYYIKNAINKAHDTWVYVDDNGELIDELNKDMVSLPKFESLKEDDNLEEDIVLFDPFGADFSECEPMEVCSDNHRADCCKDFNVNAVDFFKELAAELGIADEVEISEKECADDSCEEKHEDEIPCDNCENEISEISDEVKDLEDVVPEEVKANEEPNVEVQVDDEGIEAPAEEVSKCHVCPECGKEICEDIGCKVANVEYNDDDNEDVHVLIKVKPEDTEETISDALYEKGFIQVYVNDIYDYPHGCKQGYYDVVEVLDESVCPECGKEICECGNKELVEKNKVTYTTGDPAIGDAHFNGAFEGGEGVSENLEEESHPREAQPEVDRIAAFNKALEVAKKENKPVIYGYFGSDKHGGQRYFEIDHIVCDDLSKCTKDVMKQYNPSGSVMVAYPDKDFVEQLDEDLESEDIVLTEGPLGAIAKGIKGIGKGIAGAVKGIGKEIAAGASGVKELVKKDFLGTDANDVDKIYNKYQVNCKDASTGGELKDKKTFTKFMDAAEFALQFSKTGTGYRAYIFPVKEDGALADDFAAKYVDGKLSANKLKDIISKNKEAVAAKKADDKVAKAQNKATDKMNKAAEKSIENKEEKAKKDQEAKDNELADAKGEGQSPVEKPAEEQKPAEETKPEEAKPVEEKPAEEKPVEAPAKSPKDMSKVNNSKKLIKALNKIGIDTSALIIKYTGKDGKEHQKGTDALLQLRKELFGEALEEEIDLDEEIPNSELEDKMLFVEEQEEMSDLELAERLEAALKEKHCEK